MLFEYIAPYIFPIFLRSNIKLTVLEAMKQQQPENKKAEISKINRKFLVVELRELRCKFESDSKFCFKLEIFSYVITSCLFRLN